MRGGITRRWTIGGHRDLRPHSLNHRGAWREWLIARGPALRRSQHRRRSHREPPTAHQTSYGWPPLDGGRGEVRSCSCSDRPSQSARHARIAGERQARSAAEGRAACAWLGTAHGAAYVFDPTGPKPGRRDDETLMTDGRQKLTRLGIQLLALTVEDFS